MHHLGQTIAGMDLLGAQGGCYFHHKAEKYNDRHIEIHVLVMICHTLSCLIFSLLLIFKIALAFWMYDHVFIMNKYSCILKGRVTHMTKTNTTQVLNKYPSTRDGRAPPPPIHPRPEPQYSE